MGIVARRRESTGRDAGGRRSSFDARTEALARRHKLCNMLTYCRLPICRRRVRLETCAELPAFCREWAHAPDVNRGFRGSRVGESWAGSAPGA
jgi:hypothetical protein